MAGRLGGLSGDSYGAVCELTEAGVLVALGLQIGGVGG
jgi:cobalamin synthase